jgi:hypothetical protein
LKKKVLGGAKIKKKKQNLGQILFFFFLGEPWGLGVLLHATPTLRPFFFFFFVQAIPHSSLVLAQRERERERERLSQRRQGGRWEAESSLEEELKVVEQFPSPEIGGPTGLESDIEKIGGQSRSRARQS